jgi:uncharacterized protein (DUF1800 family)
MELFTLGIGNYTEQDIKEAARAFTGWGHDGDDFIFRQYDHDAAEKVFFGKRGNFDGDDIISIIMEHPACGPYIAGKLFEFFAYEDPEPAMVQSLGALLKERSYELRPLLRTLLTSRAFYSDRAIGTQIKSPIQLVVGTVRMLGVEMPGPRQLYQSMQQMGQIPFEPPNVRGWPGGRMWINTSTLFVRYNTAVALAGGAGVGRLGRKLQFKPDAADSTPQRVVRQWVDRLIQRPIAPEREAVLVDALQGRPDREENLKRMIHLIVSMPEYQLC